MYIFILHYSSISWAAKYEKPVSSGGSGCANKSRDKKNPKLVVIWKIHCLETRSGNGTTFIKASLKYIQNYMDFYIITIYVVQSVF